MNKEGCCVFSRKHKVIIFTLQKHSTVHYTAVLIVLTYLRLSAIFNVRKALLCSFGQSAVTYAICILNGLNALYGGVIMQILRSATEIFNVPYAYYFSMHDSMRYECIRKNL